MGRAFFRVFNAVNVLPYRLTRGRFGGKVQGLPVLLLSAVGRRSGKKRITPLGYFEDEGRYVVIASNAGFDRHPGWFHNLKSQPRVTIEIGEKIVPVDAKVVDGDLYSRLWARLLYLSPGYERYAIRTRRVIPLLTLTPNPSPAERERGRGEGHTSSRAPISR